MTKASSDSTAAIHDDSTKQVNTDNVCLISEFW